MNTEGDFMRKIYTECPVEYTASLIANKWKILILRDLLTGTKRYNELTKSKYSLTKKGSELKPIFDLMYEYGNKYKKK